MPLPANKTGLSCSSLSLAHSGPGIDSLKIADVLIGVWVHNGTERASYDTIYRSWFANGSVVFLSGFNKGMDIVPTGAVDDYLGTTMKGHVGLVKMMEAHPEKKWYGLLGEDNYLHWPSLLAGLAEVTAARADGVPELAVGETRCGDRQRVCPDGKPNRLYGGAGIFVNAAMARELRSHALEPLIAACNQCQGENDCATDCARGEGQAHDEHLSGLILNKLKLNLTQGDFLLSQPPCFYVTQRKTGCTPLVWLRTPPAVFHYMTSLEIFYYAKLASFAANATFEPRQLSVPGIPRAPNDPAAFTFHTRPWGPQRPSNTLCGHKSASCFHVNCAPSEMCITQLLVLNWGRLQNRRQVPILNSMSLPGSNLNASAIV
jgi:hypothetical protein